MFKKLSLALAHAISNNIEIEEAVGVYAYGLEIVFGSLVKIIILFALSYLFGIVRPLFFVLLAFVPIRHFAGGTHLSTYMRCLALGVMMLLILARLSLVGITYSSLLGFFAFTEIITLHSIYRWVPAGTEKKTVNDPKLRMNRKVNTVKVVLVIT